MSATRGIGMSCGMLEAAPCRMVSTRAKVRKDVGRGGFGLAAELADGRLKRQRFERPFGSRGKHLAERAPGFDGRPERDTPVQLQRILQPQPELRGGRRDSCSRSP